MSLVTRQNEPNSCTRHPRLRVGTLCKTQGKRELQPLHPLRLKCVGNHMFSVVCVELLIKYSKESGWGRLEHKANRSDDVVVMETSCRSW